MTRMLETLRQRSANVLRDLYARPVCLFCLLLAANAVFLPYGNFVHDANLYGVQVLNRVDPGRFDNDLYFQYGSQDKFSVFSLAAAPLVAQLGLPAGFFVLYFLGNSLFLFALQRLVRALVKDPIVSTLALLFMAITAMPFGGLSVFHINESFLTPRIAVNALVLLGLERLIAGQPLPALGLMLLAAPLHPLMALPGLLILAVWFGMTHLPWKWSLSLLSLGAAAVVVILFDRPLGLRFLGAMDDTWKDSVERVGPYLFPLDWRVEDWMRIVLSFVMLLGSIRDCIGDVPLRRVLLAMGVVAAAGLVGGVAVCFLPYALPLQGQPYRWLWPLELSLYPLGFRMTQRLWVTQRTTARLAALGLLAYLNASSWDNPLFLLLALSVALFSVLVWRGMSSQPHVSNWTVRAAVCAICLTLPLWTAFKLGLIAAVRHQLCSLLEPVELLMLLAALVDPMCRLALVLGSLICSIRFAAPGWRLITACSGVWATAGLVFFVFPQTRFYADHCTLHGAEERFLAEYLVRWPSTGRVPTIYWPCRNIARIWFELRTNIYFEWPHQIAGNLFSAGTAREGTRRARLVKKFEMERLREERILYAPWLLTQFLTVYRATGSEPAPDVDDLLELCREKQLDLIVIPQEFPGLYAARTGKFFIYDCRGIRANSLEVVQRKGLSSREP
jgi:hypothetical protein